MTDVNVTIEADVITSYELFYGRCYCHIYWQMLWPIVMRKMLNHICYELLQQVCRLMLLPVADGMATAGWLIIVADVIALGLDLILSSEVLSRTSSQIWGRWYLPIFLLGMDYWPLCTMLLWLLYWGFGPPSQQCWNSQWWFGDQWCCYGHRLGRGPSDVL